MEKLYYIKTQFGKTDEVIAKLKSLGLNTNVVETNYYEYKRNMHGELIAWNESAKFPCFVHRAMEELITKCGIPVEY